MLEITENAGDYLQNFESQINQFKTSIEKSMSNVENYSEDKIFLIKKYKEKLGEININYRELLSKLDTTKNSVTLAEEEYNSLNSILNSALHSLDELNKIINKK